MRLQALGVGLGITTILTLSAGCGSTSGDVLTSALDGASGDDGSQGSEADRPGPGVDATVSDAASSDANRGDASGGEADGGGGGDGGVGDGSVEGAEAAMVCGDSGQVCAAPLQCTGVACSCLIACDVSMVQRSDGSLWWYADPATSASPIAVTTQDGSLFLASSFSASQGGLACGVRQSDATAWCWTQPLACDAGVCTAPGGTYDLGNGSTAASLTPVQVVTAAAAPLANIAAVSVDLYGTTACAVDSAGGAWCWGAAYTGALGTGATTTSNFAAPVLTAEGGSPFTGVAEIATSLEITCARKVDGTVWCWGNTQAFLPDGGLMLEPFPVQVSLSGNATLLSVDDNNACAVLADTSIWCWATNMGGTFVQGIEPTRLFDSSGEPFVGAVTVTVDGVVAHAVKADGSLWVWYAGEPNAQPQSNNGTPAASVEDAFVLCQSGFVSPSYIDTKGLFSDYTAVPVGVPVTCQ